MSSGSWGLPAVQKDDSEGVTRGGWGAPRVPKYDGELGACAEILMHGGHAKAAALMRDVHELRLEVDQNGWGEVTTAVLAVEPWVLTRFDDETKAKVQEALNIACHGHSVDGVYVTVRPASPGWREQLMEQLAKAPTNQATLAPLPDNHPRADGLSFRTPEEVRVYEALKRAQEARPADDTFSIVPNCAVRFLNRTLEPDFLINFRGRCAAIEVDGASHDRKWGSDKSRDDLLMESGLAFVKRLDARDMANPAELHAAISRVLNRLERGQ